MAFLGYIKCLGYDIYVPVYSDIPANENITNAPIIKASSLHSVGYPNDIPGISYSTKGYEIWQNSYSAAEASEIIARFFGDYHFETVNGATPFIGLVLGDDRNLSGYYTVYSHWHFDSPVWRAENPVYIGWNPDEFQLCMALISGTNKVALYGGITGSTNQTAQYIRMPEYTDLTVDNIANYLKLYQEREITDPEPIEPTSLLMGYRVGQMIRGMRKQQKEDV